MSICRFLKPCGVCEIKSMSGIPYTCDLMRTDKLPVPKFVEDKNIKQIIPEGEEK